MARPLTLTGKGRAVGRASSGRRQEPYAQLTSNVGIGETVPSWSRVLHPHRNESYSQSWTFCDVHTSQMTSSRGFHIQISLRCAVAQHEPPFLCQAPHIDQSSVLSPMCPMFEPSVYHTIKTGLFIWDGIYSRNRLLY